MSLSENEKVGWIETLDRLHGRLLSVGTSGVVEHAEAVTLIAHAVGTLCRLEADRMRVSADPDDFGQLELFDGVNPG